MFVKLPDLELSTPNFFLDNSIFVFVVASSIKSFKIIIVFFVCNLFNVFARIYNNVYIFKTLFVLVKQFDTTFAFKTLYINIFLIFCDIV